MADMFTKAEEQGKGKKIAFESAAVNLRKDMAALIQAHSLNVLFMKGNRRKVVFVWCFMFVFFLVGC